MCFMKLGLVRHYKVITNGKYFLTSKEFEQVMFNYDVAPVRENGLRLNSNEWDICYCSTLPRAITTAKSIYNKEIIKTDLLVEVPIRSFAKINFPLPNFLWHFGSRIAWFFNSATQLEGYRDTQQRINDFIYLIENSDHQNILIVSHGFFMKVLVKQLKKKGFSGFIDFAPKNGKLYTLNN